MRLWEEQDKLLKRTMVVAILLGLLLPVKVFKPMTKVSQKTENELKELRASTEKREQIERLERALDDMENTFNTVQLTLEREPWNEEKERLIRTYRVMRSDRTRVASREEIQGEADKTIRTIGGMVTERIIHPLEGSLPPDPDIKEAFQAFSEYLTTLNRDIEQWETEHVGMVWYSTIDDKSEAMDELTVSLRDRLRDLPGLLQEEQRKIDEQREKLTIHTAALEEEISEIESNLDDLEREMQQILPGWLRGIVGISEMIQIFPALLLVLTLYVFWLAISLTRHYNIVAGEISLTPEDKRDPSTSSTWTLTNRGKIGTLITVAGYLAFTIIMWSGFEWGHRLLNSWITDDNSAWYGSLVGTDGFLWFGRLMLGICLVFIVFRKTIFGMKSESLKNVLVRKSADYDR